MTRHVRFRGPDGIRTATVDELPVEPLDPDTLELPDPYELLMPVEPPEVWCAGVTYERSRDARIEESRGRRLQPRLRRRAARALPQGRRLPPHGRARPADRRPRRLDAGTSRSRRSRSCSATDGAIDGYTIGNDVSSRAIEGENPLYLPQAKLFAGACAIGPAIVPDDGAAAEFEIRMRILGRDGSEVFAGETSTARMQRSFEELVSWLRPRQSRAAG